MVQSVTLVQNILKTEILEAGKKNLKLHVLSFSQFHSFLLSLSRNGIFRILLRLVLHEFH